MESFQKWKERESNSTKLDLVDIIIKEYSKIIESSDIDSSLVNSYVISAQLNKLF